MTNIYSPQVLGVPFVLVTPEHDVLPTDDSPFLSHGNLRPRRYLFITMNVKLTRPASHSVDGEGRLVFDAVRGPGRTIKFMKLFSQRLDALVGATARDAIAIMLSAVYVPETLQSDAVVDKILESIRRMAEQRPTGRNVWSVNYLDVRIAAFVDELPTPSADDNYLIHDENVNTNFNIDGDDDELIDSNDDFSDSVNEAELNSFDDYNVRFEPASNESIESLERVRVPAEKAVSCSVCLDDVVAGSEAIRLPCSHLHHGDCIVKWLRKSKYCPLCRFEMPS